jgi:poly(hydroxyalkanoate) depolymerase family esterase
MRNLGKIVARMSALRTAMDAANANDDGRLDVLTGFGSNPGELDCRVYVPKASPTGLIVVLHGCTQNAAVYDRGSGWSKLAERYGLAVLFPQQRRANNPNLCFNWYLPADARRNRGEAMSISEMVQYVAARYGLDRSRTFVTGLSAGGAMTAVMLACYPDLFAGGAVIAGLPFAAANTLPNALQLMRGQGFPDRGLLAARAKAAPSFMGHPPTLSVWHGTNDAIVVPANATAIVDQWRDLHGLGHMQGQVGSLRGHRHEVWSDAEGRTCVERIDIRGMGHGTPIDPRSSEACGTPGPHMLDAGICSTEQIAISWGLVEHSAELSTRHAPEQARQRTGAAHRAPGTMPKQNGVGAIIGDALRSAGLMR